MKASTRSKRNRIFHNKYQETVNKTTKHIPYFRKSLKKSGYLRKQQQQRGWGERDPSGWALRGASQRGRARAGRQSARRPAERVAGGRARALEEALHRLDEKVLEAQPLRLGAREARREELGEPGLLLVVQGAVRVGET